MIQKASEKVKKLIENDDEFEEIDQTDKLGFELHIKMNLVISKLKETIFAEIDEDRKRRINNKEEIDVDDESKLYLLIFRLKGDFIKK
jgi:hypothetical protein